MAMSFQSWVQGMTKSNDGPDVGWQSRADFGRGPFEFWAGVSSLEVAQCWSRSAGRAVLSDQRITSSRIKFRLFGRVQSCSSVRMLRVEPTAEERSPEEPRPSCSFCWLGHVDSNHD